MDILLSTVMALVFLVILVVTLKKSRQYQWLVTPALFYASLLFFVFFFGNMMLSQYFPDYAKFVIFVKEVIDIHPVIAYFIIYALCLFGLFRTSERI